MVEVSRIPAGRRSDWLALRKEDVTASTCAALLGAHEFMSPLQLWALKSGAVNEDPEETPPMRRGRLLEPVAVQLLREQNQNWTVTHNSGLSQLYLRAPALRLGATPDVFANNPKRGTGVVQIKSVEASLFRQKWLSEDGAIEPPAWIAVQAIVEAKLAEASWAMVAALIVGHGIDLHLVEVPIHQGVFDRVCEETIAFWDRVEREEKPEPDFARDAHVLERLYGNNNGTEIDLSTDNRMPHLLEERANLKAAASAAAASLKPIEAEIIAKLGAHDRAYLPGWRVSRPVVRRKAHFVEASAYRKLSITRAS